MSILEIEIDPNLDSQQWLQDFEGSTYRLKFIYNSREDQYQFELYNTSDVLLASAPLVLGQAIFDEYSTDDLPPGVFIVRDASGEGGPANQEKVGRGVKFYYVDSTETVS